MTERIAEVRVASEILPLKKPYKLSFDTLTCFTSIRVIVTLENGNSSVGEVVPLFGYSDETEDAIREYLSDNLNRLTGLYLNEARDLIAVDVENKPFAVSPVLTAIDLFDFDLISEEKAQLYPTIVPVDTANSKIYEEISALSNTVKVKLSGNLNEDISFFEAIKNAPMRNELILRLDANQGYNLNDAITFYSYISQNLESYPKIEYIEQPLHVNDWKGVEELVANFKGVPTMLDESIVTKKDLDKAINIGVPFVKLKLFKQGGIKELIELSEYAHQEGVRLILGNGVATWLSNRVELSVYDQYNRCFYGAHEANGYLKLQTL